MTFEGTPSIVPNDGTGIWCQHTGARELRKRILSNGAPNFIEQCLECGASTGVAWKKYKAIEYYRATGIDEADIPLWDAALAERGQLERQQRRRDELMTFTIEREFERAERQQRYREYLQSEHWRALRSRVLRRAKGVCEGCGVDRATQVHHLTYDHIGNEFLWELVAICDECHERAHQPHPADKLADYEAR